MIANRASSGTSPKPLPGKAKVSEKAMEAAPVASFGSLWGARNPSVLKNPDSRIVYGHNWAHAVNQFEGEEEFMVQRWGS